MTILEQLKIQHKRTGGHCGMYINDFKGEREDIKKQLKKLHKENKITIHEGIHGKLIKQIS
ncbi:hypothetical protein T190611E02C_40307 [Tenacibaculum sp. 190524A05c]|uniref:hypothetical protein n=1 Tax=Tenacibaculum platacis TaxID=3137852 RepID=UPI0031FAA214